ncbi:MAG: glucosaminidase domain-containing protein [Saprospiraceae bacterium]
MLLLLSIHGFSQDYSAYINLYKNIAQSEMERTGIPASIKLAQGILESNCGKSDLACKANNHFGIKCGNDWCGKCFNKEDDDFEEGKLVKSCFRQFSSANDSYIAHSDFLTDPAKSNRYGFLFDLKTTDYKSWAKGLAKAGYATDPRYADRLIDIIEKFDLSTLDTEIADPRSLASGISKTYRPVRYFNDIKYIVAGKNDTPLSLAVEFDLTARQINAYNDDISEIEQTLTPGSRVYLQKKRNKFNGHQQYHVLKPNEDLVSISQQYGIKISALLKRNGLTVGEVPLPNQKLLLKGRQKSELRLADPYAMPVAKQNEFKSDDTKTVGSKLYDIKSKPVATKNSTKEIAQTTIVAPLKENTVDTIPLPAQKTFVPKPEHTVSKGETLYGIARSYGLSIEELKKMNNLSVDTLSIGQKLVLK